MNKATAIFRKGTDPELDSYSDFYDNARCKSTGVAGYLREKNVNKVYLTGLAGDICVYATAMDSISLAVNNSLFPSINESDTSAAMINNIVVLLPN